MIAPSPQGDASGTASSTRRRLLVLGVFVICLIGGYILFGDYLSLEHLARQEDALKDWQLRQPLFVYGAAFLIYVAVTGLSLPGAAGLTLAFGWFFDFLPALVLVSFASTTGATIAFLLSRYLLRDAVQAKFGDRLTSFNAALKREGAFYLFTLRLVPLVPFFVINVVMGLTPIRTSTFWWVSQLGMLAGTCVYVYAGSSVPSLQQLANDGVQAVLSPTQLRQLLVAFALLGLFPLFVKKAMQYFRPTSISSEQADA